MTTLELLAETTDLAKIREGSAFERLNARVGGKIVLFGAGSLGRKTANSFQTQGIVPLAFIDNDIRLQGSEVAGIPVYSPRTATERWRNSALFVVSTFLPFGGGARSRLTELESLGCLEMTTFLSVGWKFEGVLPHFGADRPSRLLRHAKELEQVEGLWSDTLSRETFRQALAWRLEGDFREIASPVPDQYFPQDIIRPNPDEVFVDGGAFDGDTLRTAPWAFSKVLAIEPDPVNASNLRSWCGGKAQVREVLLGTEVGCALFDGKGTMASSRSEAGSLEIAVETLDNLTAGEKPTYVKLDIEGDEIAALRGGVNMLRRCQPVVAVCVYHRPEDLWTIPQFLHEVLPQHKMFLRAHAWDGFELVVYAVPKERCLLI